jgi:hypothetical protein
VDGLSEIGGGGVAGIIVAITGLITAYGAWRQAKAGSRDTLRIQEAKDELEHERLELEERRHNEGVKDSIIATLNAQLDRESARADRERAAGEAQYQKWLRCESERDRLRDQLHTVAQSLLNEAQRAAAVDGVTPEDMPTPPEP